MLYIMSFSILLLHIIGIKDRLGYVLIQKKPQYNLGFFFVNYFLGIYKSVMLPVITSADIDMVSDSVG